MKKVFCSLFALLCAAALTLPAMADALPFVPFGKAVIAGGLLLILLGIVLVAAAIIIIIIHKNKK